MMTRIDEHRRGDDAALLGAPGSGRRGLRLPLVLLACCTFLFEKPVS